MRYIIALLLFCFTLNCFSQEAEQCIYDNDSSKINLDEVPFAVLMKLDNKYYKLSASVNKHSRKLIESLQAEEEKLQIKLSRVDSLKAQALFQKTQEQYARLKTLADNPVDIASAKLKEYIPNIDSANTVLKFLSQYKDLSALSSGKLEQLSQTLNSLQDLQGRLQQANEIQNFVKQRLSQLKSSLSNSALGQGLASINRKAYYYQQQIEEYKSILRDKKKLEEKLIGTVRTLPAFQKFWDKHSYLAQLFPMRTNPETSGNPIPGLQTAAGMQQLMQQRFGTQITLPTTNPAAGAGLFQEQTAVAQQQIADLKRQVDKTGGSSSDLVMPGFKPNEQKTKSFLERLEYGLNFQSEKSTSFLPATTDIAITAGYKLSDNKVIGLGASYKIGWGHGWNNISLSSQGAGFRGYADVKAKAGFWLSAGFEYNYLQTFSNLRDLHTNIDVWQQSALAGITKKYKISKGREGKIQILYDFLHNKHLPASQGLKFRVGWGF
ncbi:hypothetical protein I5907_15860 [Panacibacter sp. DH6]|uniref:DUF3575 domain-containing protein n=1 Tax=Panacibacter microcysteis TaxID=2793269 RepID=A0A931E625_9BACT|nr:hypothetical protein [Panacibacter microcysteis]MBG9377718.1 hypothetical protein [Panacibacter microcysteis]